MQSNSQVTKEEAAALIAEKVAARKRALTDKLFLAEQLGYVFQEDVHKPLFDSFIQFDSSKPYLFQSDIKKRLILWSRGHFKTTSIVVEIIQTILNFPNVTILLMQGGLANSKERLAEVASHFTGEAANSKLTELFPEFCGDKKEIKFSAERFTTPARTEKQNPQPTVSVASPKALKTGKHYDVGFFDDLINEHNFTNPQLLRKAEQQFNGCIPLINPGGYFYVTGTRYTFGDMYENIIRANTTTKEWVISVKNCWSDDGTEPRFKQRISRFGKPIGFTREGLLAIQATDPIMFASQYMNQPLSESQQVITEEMMVAGIIHPDSAPKLSETILFVDLASSKAKRADDSVIFAGKHDSFGRSYVVDGRGGQWDPQELVEHIMFMALRHRPVKIMLEGTGACQYLANDLRNQALTRGIVLPLESIKVDNQPDAKNIRIKQMANALKNKRLFFFPGISCWGKMMEQCTTYPKAADDHDDYPDTLALMVAEFTKLGTALTATSIVNRRQNFFDNIFGTQRQQSQSVLNEREEPSINSMGSDFAF